MDKIKLLLLVGFFLSGMAALIYEVTWTRHLQLIFGSTIYAVSTMLTAFLAGFALGAYAFRNKAENEPLKLFAILELSIGLYGLVIINLFALLPFVYLSFLWLPGSQFLQFALCFTVLLIPATLMGGLWPAVSRAYADLDTIGRDLGKIYSFNSFGSALGPIFAGFLLIPAIGITNTSLFAASLNLLVGAIIFLKVKK